MGKVIAMVVRVRMPPDQAIAFVEYASAFQGKLSKREDRIVMVPVMMEIGQSSSSSSVERVANAAAVQVEITKLLIEHKPTPEPVVVEEKALKVTKRQLIAKDVLSMLADNSPRSQTSIRHEIEANRDVHHTMIYDEIKYLVLMGKIKLLGAHPKVMLALCTEPHTVVGTKRKRKKP